MWTNATSHHEDGRSTKQKWGGSYTDDRSLGREGLDEVLGDFVELLLGLSIKIARLLDGSHDVSVRALDVDKELLLEADDLGGVDLVKVTTDTSEDGHDLLLEGHWRCRDEHVKWIWEMRR